MSTSSTTTNRPHAAAIPAPISPRLFAKLRPRRRDHASRITIPTRASEQIPASQQTAVSELYFPSSTETMVIAPKESATPQASRSLAARARNPSRSQAHARQYPGASSSAANAATDRRQPSMSPHVNALSSKPDEPPLAIRAFSRFRQMEEAPGFRPRAGAQSKGREQNPAIPCKERHSPPSVKMRRGCYTDARIERRSCRSQTWDRPHAEVAKLADALA